MAVFVVAIKVMAASMLGSVAKELVAQGKLIHPHVVRLNGTQVDLDKRRVYMVMELCPGGELFDRIAECGKLEETAARRYLLQMADGLIDRLEQLGRISADATGEVLAQVKAEHAALVHVRHADTGGVPAMSRGEQPSNAANIAASEAAIVAAFAPRLAAGGAVLAVGDYNGPLQLCTGAACAQGSCELGRVRLHIHGTDAEA